MQYKELPKCPVETTLKLIGTKWRILIIKVLLDGTKRFCEIKKGTKGITQKVLSAQLKDMEKLGILTRREYEQNPPKVEYTLTDIGYSLRPVVESLKDWGKDYKKYTKLMEKYGS